MKIDKTLTPDELYDRLPEDERVTALILRALIFETLPEAHEKLSWGAPFYFRKRAVCFVWPSSVPWGKLEEGVALGFSRAKLLDHGGYLSNDGKSMLGRRVFFAPEEIDVERVQKLLLEAWDTYGRL